MNDVLAFSLYFSPQTFQKIAEQKQLGFDSWVFIKHANALRLSNERIKEELGKNW